MNTQSQTVALGAIESATNLVEIGQIGNFVPEATHYVLKFGQLRWIAIAFALDDACTQCHALEIILIQKAIVVDICLVEKNKIKQTGSKSVKETIH